MTKKHYLWLILALTIVFLVLLIPTTTSYVKDEPEVIIEPEKPTLSHKQDTWIRALEWCESNGVVEAINPQDLDNTPSYGAFQFKPSTFEHFKARYGIEGELMDRDAQYLIVIQMVLERDKIQWDRQFPGCVRKLGYPPRS